MKKRIAILGSTGSIGTQALEVIQQHEELFSVEVLSAQKNADLLIKQALNFKPDTVIIGNKNLYSKVHDALNPLDIKVFAGEESLAQVAEMGNSDLVLNALVGFAALKPTLNAIESGKTLAMANKETFAVAGELVIKKAKQKNATILPVDSEHSAIFQCLAGEHGNPIEKIYLTASGGPFRELSASQVETVTKEDALKHPNWNMGNKITVDSASLMNKGLEVIEAKWLFDLKPEQIDVVVHPQSIIHSMVEFEDGSIKAQMGLPDMKGPIQYALTYPKREKSNFKKFSFDDFSNLTFSKPRKDVFRNLELAYYALNRAGNMPCILNAANEIAVEAFLKDQIGFIQMSDIIETAMNKITFISHPSLDNLIHTDTETRAKAKDLIESLSKQ
ncbi:MAG: 1-deoxy-D-xylulose-5-phosphate reductoisomerase [Bacteroidales bacterium]|nr:1-deoxy-D-xylulose-5-phosphate reductoisomerase [Bacteroidales bacterium]MCF8326885.1 1-deoxy-D-xylulose-5-phosphate reductoisomerase [Bacteroidales bacterium]